MHDKGNVKQNDVYITENRVWRWVGANVQEMAKRNGLSDSHTYRFIMC